ncbi:MAG: MBL fold metallo-hydrolase [Xanthomonadaceae bacterium]|jgi:competence protein ComEC|nr:MBL fold metallo-hydrolase [Xanthomonadaceae bacterium]
MPACYVVDVGHGNATVLAHDCNCVVIDAGPGDALANFLSTKDLRHVQAMLLSHADADHIGGAISLISRLDADPDFWIAEIYLNPDPRDTDVFNDLIVALQDLVRRRGRKPQVRTSLGHGEPADPIAVGPAQVSVLAPSVEQRLRGVAYAPDQGPPANANRLSAVILISQADQPWVLAPGDLDQVGFEALLAAGVAIRAPVLVYPHHGGRAGSDAQSRALANGLLTEVQPETVIFSVRSADRRFPSQLTVDALLTGNRVPALVCTGDSPTLQAALAVLADSHSHRNGAGTQVIEVDGSGLIVRSLQ